MPPQNVLLWHLDYFKQTIRAQQTKEELFASPLTAQNVGNLG